jgi:hypothetical protein
MDLSIVMLNYQRVISYHIHKLSEKAFANQDIHGYPDKLVI